MKFNMIVACCENNGIGKQNSIPWNLKTETAYFKKITTHTTNPVLKNVVIMGRKTWESIPEKYRPLENRINIVLTKNDNYDVPKDVLVCGSLEESFGLVNSIPNSNKNNVFVIGGESVYRESIDNDNLDKIYVTKIYEEYGCDRFFPDIPENLVLSAVSDFIEEKGIYYRKLVYTNKNLNSQVCVWKNNEEMQYINCLKNILTVGFPKNDRTGVGTLSLFGNMFKYNLADTFPLLTTKKMWVRAVFEELKFYLSGKTDNTILNDKKITIWNGNTTREFLDKKNLHHYPVNDMGESYGFNFRHFGAEYKTCRENYEGQGFDQLEYVIDLIKNDPHSRRIIIDLWNCSTLHKAALPPCLCKYQFFCNTQDKKLDLMIYLRSSDFFLANNWNVCTGAFFVHMLCSLDGIELTPGVLTVVTADTHIYKSHIDQVHENLSRTPRPYPKLVVLNRQKNIMDFKFSDFKLIGYDPYPNIKAEMAV